MKIGAFRVDYFESSENQDPFAFGFYIRGEINSQAGYSIDAKMQLYSGWLMIRSQRLLSHLKAVYVDIDSLDKLERPAYVQLKHDLYEGLFRQLFIFEESALIGCEKAEDDLRQLAETIEGFELLVCRNGECVPFQLG